MTYQVRSSSRWMLGLGIFVVVLLPAFLTVLLRRQSGQMEESYVWVRHTHSVLEELERLRDLVIEAERSQRNYLLTAQEEYETDFRNLVQAVPVYVQNVRDLIADNPAQRARFEQCVSAVNRRLELMDENTRFIPKANEADIQHRIAASVEQSHQLDLQFQDISDTEKDLLQERRVHFHEANETFQHMAYWFMGGGTVMLLGIAFFFYDEYRSRLRYEARLAEARDTALDAVKTTSAFVAAVSHEIRTPMNGVLGTADLLMRDTSLTKRQRDGLETIRGSGVSLLAIIDDILDLSKLQAGEMSFVHELFSPAEVVEEVISLFAAAAAKKDLELAPHLSAEVPALIRGDRLRLRQILLNLVSNAIKFTETGGISIHVVRRAESERDGKVCLRFDVSDTGPGIAKEAQARLFMPFAQVNEALSRKHGGTGLGLAVSRELVQKMNGAMGVESTPGHGATFWFTVVLGAVEGVPEAGALEPEPFLIIENRPLTAEALRSHVEAWGLRPFVYSYVEDMPATEPWEPGVKPKAVVIGSHSKWSWLGTVRHLRRLKWMDDVQLFVMTGDEELSQSTRQSEGIAAVLRYPFRPSELYDLLAGVGEAKTYATTARKLDLPPATIIVADDNPVNQRVLCNQLEYLGLKSILCNDGAEALARAKEGTGDLVLMDCQMPVMDGFEATQAIRQWERSSSRPPLPIIAVTAHVMSGDAELCLQSGMDAYLSKPIDVERLQQMLAVWLPKAKKEVQPLATADSQAQPEIAKSGAVNVESLVACLTGEAELDRELVEMAVKLAEESLDKMKKAQVDGADAVWRQAAHKARGSCGTLGFVVLAKTFNTAEFEATSHEARTRVLIELEQQLIVLKEELRRLGYLQADFVFTI